MERKRELTSVDIAAVVGELSEIQGAFVDKAYRYEDDLFRFRLRHHDHGRLELLIQIGEWKRAHLADPAHVPDAPGRPPQFARMLRNRIGGASLLDIDQYEFDRIIILEFERGDERTTVVAELFGDGNFVVLDANGQVIDAIRTVRLRSRTVAPGSQYEYPTAQRNPFEFDRDVVEQRIRESDADLVRTLATQLNLGGMYAEEICERGNIEGNQTVEDLDSAIIDTVYTELGRLGDDIRAGTFEPRIYYRDGTTVDVVPLEIERYEGLEFDRFDRFNDAVDEYFRTLRVVDAEEETPDVAEEIAKQQRVIDQQEAAIEDFAAEADRTRAAAEALYSHYDLVDDVLSSIREARDDGRSWQEIEHTFASAARQGNERAAAVRSIDETSGTVTLELDSHSPTIDIGESIERNADRLYQEAKAIEEKREGAIEALADTRERLRSLKKRDSQPVAESPDDVDSRPTDWTARSSVPVRVDEQWYERFRWFHTSDGFLVIGGRNADQNEELVKKYLEPYDRFAHAQAHGGPATILKASGPSERAQEIEFPERTLRETAQFAVSYSSVWKAGQFGGEAYHVAPEQVTKTPESGETLEKGAFVIRGDREYIESVPVGIAIGITCEPETRVIGGPPDPVEERAAASVRIEPGEYAQSDVAKRIYRHFRETFTDTTFVRKVASPDRIQEFLPPGHSSIVE